MRSEEKKEVKPLTLSGLINQLEDLAAHYDCGDWQVKVNVGGVSVPAFSVWRVWSRGKGREKFVEIR